MSLSRPSPVRSRLIASAVALLLTVALLPATARTADAATAMPARIDTAVPTNAAIAISQQLWGTDEAVHVALSRDDNWPDSLAGTALTSLGPLLFTDKETLTPATATELRRVLPPGGTVHLLGGTAAISGDIETQLRNEGFDVRRLSDRSRVGTAVAVARRVKELNPDVTSVIVARAYGTARSETAGWADSVSVGAYAARYGIPVVVTGSDTLDPQVAAFLRDELKPTRTFVLGGTAALSEAVEAAVPNPLRISGTSRDGTAVAVAEDLWRLKVAPKGGSPAFVVVNGYDERGWAFGMAAAGLAQANDAAIVVTNTPVVPQTTLDLVATCQSATAAPTLSIIGSTQVIPQAREDELRAARQDCTPDRSADSYAFLIDWEGAPVRYDPCTPLSFVANYAGAQPGAETAVRRALDEVERATGIDLVYEGQTSERLADTFSGRETRQARYGDRPAPILINWPSQWSSQGWGYGSSTTGPFGQGERPWFESGYVALRSDVNPSPSQLQTLLMHEIAHVLGLDHVDDRAQVMYPSIDEQTAWGAGDRNGLDLVGLEAGCRP